MTALVGPSGAGKTTLSSLVPRLYDVVAGSITHRRPRRPGRDPGLAEPRPSGWSRQDAHLFHDTIAANLRYARPGGHRRGAGRGRLPGGPHPRPDRRRCPTGYDTVVGERGYRLSGGEKQRLAIARVLLKDPAVVILDEATAHLDSETELLVQQALAEALAGRTSIVIAHRLSTIQAADQILVLDDGRDRGPGHPRVADRRGRPATPTSTRPSTCGAPSWWRGGRLASRRATQRSGGRRLVALGASPASGAGRRRWSGCR